MLVSSKRDADKNDSYTNGFSAWLITNLLFIWLSVLGILDPAIIVKHWPALLISVNICGYLLSSFAYFKAYLFPTHKADLKFSGSRIYDFYMGIEFNPRFGSTWDFKLFINGRPGIIAWTLIDLSFVAWQYEAHGYISNSIVIVSILHAIYVVDFFINEDWYLRTIDIAHDHFGFYLAWGSLVWLPSMYTLQTQYLARYPVNLPWPVAAVIFGTGVAGYMLFRSVNWQKDVVRRTNGDCLIWGKKAEVIVCDYVTQDGGKHQSLLLCSGTSLTTLLNQRLVLYYVWNAMANLKDRLVGIVSPCELPRRPYSFVQYVCGLWSKTFAAMVLCHLHDDLVTASLSPR
jgi:7-dehydrocholesterol reductase